MKKKRKVEKKWKKRGNWKKKWKKYKKKEEECTVDYCCNPQ